MQVEATPRGGIGFIQGLLVDGGIRVDGRGLAQARRIVVSMNAIVGCGVSARVVVGQGYKCVTEMVAAAGCEIVPFGDGGLSIRVDALPGVFADDTICAAVKEVVVSAISNAGAIGQERFVVADCSNLEWAVRIDLLYFQAWGGLLEAAFVGVRECLGRVLLPAVVVRPRGLLGEWQVEFDEKGSDRLLVEQGRVPSIVSFACVGDDVLVVDPTPPELTAAGTLLAVSLDGAGAVVGLSHFGQEPTRSWTIDAALAAAAIAKPV